MTINFTRYFDRFRQIADAIAVYHTALGTTIPNAVELVLAEFDTATLDGNPLTRNLVNAAGSLQIQTSLATTLFQLAGLALIEEVEADAPHAARSTRDAAAELIRQMRANSQTVDANTVSVSVSAPDTEAPTLAMSIKDAEGYNLEQCIPETIVGVGLTSGGVELQAEKTVTDARYDWPGGSGIRRSLSVTAPSSGLLVNPSFDEEDDRADTPDDWIISTGTIGTTISVTNSETQTVAISGTPTSGYYVLSWTTAEGSVLSTTPLAYDATAEDVETALRELPGLTEVEVTSTGTSPNYTHTVTFEGVRPGGNQSALSASNTFDSGSITITETSSGGLGQTWKALALVGNGVQLQQVRQRVTLTALTCYALSVQLRRDSGATGIVEFELVDGAGNVITDEAGSNNRLTVNLTSVSDSAFAAHTTFFRTPKTMPEVVYFQIRASTAIANTKTLYVDDAILVSASQLYNGGPYAVLFENDRDATPDDRYTVTVANDHAGHLQTYFGRIFNRALLPSNAAASETISDTTTTTTTTTAP